MARIVRNRILVMVVVGLLLAGLALFFVFAGKRWWQVFSSPEELRRVVQAWGPWAPLGTILLQLVQIVFAPLPGNVMAFAAGYALGFWPTIVWLMIGVLAGATFAFLIARFFGRRLLSLFVPSAALAKFDATVVRRGTFYIFLLLLVPNPIGDWVYYLAGLTKLPLPFFLFLVLIARLPSNIIECGVGASAIRFGTRGWIVFAFVVVVFSALYLLNQRRIERLLERFAQVRGAN
ncbi:MAG: VTT domain-containing protein [candidate division WOR-3 bacterium]